jgi:hypothetical protein
MYSTKILLAAAALAVSGLANTANAAPWDHRDGDHRFEDHRADNRLDHRWGPATRHEFHRPYVERVRIYDTLRFRHYRGIGDPYFVRGHYVVRTINPFGRIVFVEVDPYSGAFLGEFRI